jgi:hypothetical protein
MASSYASHFCAPAHRLASRAVREGRLERDNFVDSGDVALGRSDLQCHPAGAFEVALREMQNDLVAIRPDMINPAHEDRAA